MCFESYNMFHGTHRDGLLILLFHLCFDNSVTLEVLIAGTEILISIFLEAFQNLYKSTK